ncbi:hypothetical protein GGH92_006867 [Coemansia sp. RSA 2673]|nr:hypothetical protein GGH92_006867 [Coemansia sp. RSA 2673]
MLLSIDFLLVANSYRHIRSILSLVIVLSMVCFNISTQPCFVDQINYWRTYGLCCILWVSLIVAMLTNESSTLTKLSIGGIAGSLSVGVVVLFILFVIVRRINLAAMKANDRGMERDNLVDSNYEMAQTQQ